MSYKRVSATPVNEGGTGQVTLTNHGLLVGAGTTGITQLAVATNGQLPIGSSAANPVLAALSAGLGITITNGAGSISIASNFAYAVTTVNITSYNALSTDQYLSVNVTTAGGAVTINLPNLPTPPGSGRYYIIKDNQGSASTKNIIITTPGGVVTFDGFTTYTMNTNFESVQMVWNGTAYSVI